MMISADRACRSENRGEVSLHVSYRFCNGVFPGFAGMLGVLVGVENAAARGDERAFAIPERGAGHVRRCALRTIPREEEDRSRKPLAEALEGVRLRGADDGTDRAIATGSDERVG